MLLKKVLPSALVGFSFYYCGLLVGTLRNSGTSGGGSGNYNHPPTTTDASYDWKYLIPAAPAAAAAAAAASSSSSSLSLMNPEKQQQQQLQRQNQEKKREIGKDIVQKAYKRTYPTLIQHCSDPAVPFRECIQSLHQQLLQKHQNSLLLLRNNDTTSSSSLRDSSNSNNDDIPWWFQSMLHAASNGQGSSGLYGNWHQLEMVHSRMNFCAIEKNGCKSWRELQCALNTGNVTDIVQHKSKEPTTGGTRCPPSQIGRNLMNDGGKMMSRAVFLRDPLERFLSGFLYLCNPATTNNRKEFVHCTPNAVFSSNDADAASSSKNKNKNNKKSNFLIGDFLRPTTQHRLFEAYVDTTPLQWNLHFYPQSFYCDGLYRHFRNYDFVGIMGPTFYDDIYKMGIQYGPDVQAGLEKVFHVSKKLQQQQQRRRQQETTATDGGSTTTHRHVGKERDAAGHVQRYYTARSVRRVLEYHAIDYVLLGLNIPDWAEEMLQQEERE